ncbi:hypothetical protein FGG08_004368 [Glutinoglossum americanum]|uniref:Uncharacterized protein n=1 Tax=Glutinoglossum americanum TaxID=1670608 RepID=A0A9P8KX58_9PEZI|nr:hypothetical protein FGG08_004368 [Glutinoglossum americanum]
MASHRNTPTSNPARRSHTTPKRQSRQRPPPVPFVQDEVDAIASELTSSYETVRRSLDEPPMQGTIDQQPIILDATPPTTPTDDKAQPRARTHLGGSCPPNAQEDSQERRHVFYTSKTRSRSGPCKDVSSTDTPGSDVKRSHSTKWRNNAQKEQRFIFIPQSDPAFYASFTPEERKAQPQDARANGNTKPIEKHSATPKLDTKLNNSSTGYSRSSSQHSSADSSRSDGITNARSSASGLKPPSDTPPTPAKSQQNRGRHPNADSARGNLAPTPPPKPDKYKPPTSQPGEDTSDGKQPNMDSSLNAKSRRRRSGRYSFIQSELPQINSLGIRTDSTDTQEKKRESGPAHQGSSSAHSSTFQQSPRKTNGPATASQQQPLPYPISPHSPPPQQATDWHPRANTSPPLTNRAGSSTAPSPSPYPPRSPSTRPNQIQGPRNYPPSSPQADSPFPAPLVYPQPLRSPTIPARDGLWSSDPLLSPRLAPTKSSTTSPPVTPGKPEFPLFLACARSGGVAGKNDWHTLVNCSSFSICPTCLEEYIVPSPFISYFRPSTRPSDAEIKCDFSNIWVRTGWNFTLQRRQNMDLFYAIAKVITSADPCPGDDVRAGSWHSIADPDAGEPVENFSVCRSCVLNIEALFPTMSGVFILIPNRQGLERVCDMRSGSKRFPKYFRMIESTADAARISFRSPDTRALTHFIRKRSSMRECTNDRLVFDKGWHTIPELPHFTICEECYNDVVWPAIDGGSMLASKCSRSMQLVWSGNDGVSCQLYSQRMRQIFEEAVTRNDLDFLRKKTSERRDKEVTIKKRLNHMLQIYASQLHASNSPQRPSQAQANANDRQATATAAAAGGGARGPRDMAMEIVRLTDEWKKWE